MWHTWHTHSCCMTEAIYHTNTCITRLARATTCHSSHSSPSKDTSKIIYWVHTFWLLLLFFFAKSLIKFIIETLGHGKYKTRLRCSISRNVIIKPARAHDFLITERATYTCSCVPGAVCRNGRSVTLRVGVKEPGVTFTAFQSEQFQTAASFSKEFEYFFEKI